MRHNIKYNNIGYDLSLLEIEKKIKNVIRIRLNNTIHVIETRYLIYIDFLISYYR